MLLFKLLLFVLVISLVKCVPVDESKNSNRPSTRRATLETYRYNHPPSISIPVSVVFEENEPGNNQKSEKSAKINTKTPDKNLAPSEESYSVAIPVAVVFEETPSKSDKLDKSKELSSKLLIENKIPSQNPSESIPVSKVLEDNENSSDNTLKFEKQDPEINIKKTKPLNKLSDIAVPVTVVFEEENVSKINILKSENSSRDSTYDKHEHTKEKKISEQQTDPIILISTESVMLDIDIEVSTVNTTSAKPKLEEEQSKVIFRPQPKQYYQLEYQIPVAVVYDDPINEVQMSRKLNNSKEQARGRNSRRRRPTSTSTTESTIEVTSVDSDFPHNPLKSEGKPNLRRRHRVKETQEKSSKNENVPVVVQFTENDSQNTQYNSRTEKSRTTPLPITEASSEKLTNNTRTQSKTPLQTQNRNSSFKAQQTEERRQDDSARKRERDPVVPIVKSDIHAYGNSGSYSYSYEGGDGTKAFGKGELKTFEHDKTGEAVVGGFSYKDKDGNDISLSYTADENGYRPVGDHLPTPPPIPVAIQRALDYLATKTTPAPVTDAGEA